jgi:hypothetical protein
MNGTQVDRVYCREYIDTLNKYDKYKYSFGQIVDKDSPGKTFGFSDDILAMECIDMDAYETDQAGLNDQTMDCACPIAKFNDTTRIYSDRKLLLLEFKLNCVNHCLGKSVYTGKMSHTRQLLATERLHGENIFIFTDSVKSKAVRQVNSWKMGSNSAVLKNALVMSPKELNNYIGFESNFPYKYRTNVDDIINSILANVDNVDQLVSELEKWKKEAEKFKKQQNIIESRYIIEILKRVVLESVDYVKDEIGREYIKLCICDI